MQFISSQKDKKFILYTNYKVLSTTLKNDNAIQQQYESKSRNPFRLSLYLIQRSYQDYIQWHYPRYLLARNPMQRLESYYRHYAYLEEDIRKNVPTIHTPTLGMQKVAQSLYGKTKSQHLIRNHSLTQELSFEAFINALPKYLANKRNRYCFLFKYLHTKMQHLLRYPSYTRLIPHAPVAITYDKILKIEDSADRVFISDQCNINLNIRLNYTKKRADRDKAWSKDMRDIVHHYYQNDFIYLGYPIEN